MDTPHLQSDALHQADQTALQPAPTIGQFCDRFRNSLGTPAVPSLPGVSTPGSKDLDPCRSLGCCIAKLVAASVQVCASHQSRLLVFRRPCGRSFASTTYRTLGRLRPRLRSPPRAQLFVRRRQALTDYLGYPPLA
jgi:hypothetical protein